MGASANTVAEFNLRPNFFALLAIGLAGGILSGLFGIGGGTIIVPALALWLSMRQKLSVGTSVAAIFPTALVGAITYAIQGNINYVAAAALTLGMIIGAQLGTYWLARLPVAVIRWGFMAFLLLVIISLWFVVPQRSATLEITFISALMLLFTGILVGILSGILGVGGGIIVVPVLMLFFGSSDLVAKGTSLLMMVPGTISGTIGNFKRQNVDFRSATIIGLSACAAVPLGALFATWLDPLLGNILFSLYLAFLLVQMLLKKGRG